MDGTHKGRCITAKDNVDIVSTPRLQGLFSRAGITKPSILSAQLVAGSPGLNGKWTASKGMYVDGHEREDVVKYPSLIKR